MDEESQFKCKFKALCDICPASSQTRIVGSEGHHGIEGENQSAKEQIRNVVNLRIVEQSEEQRSAVRQPLVVVSAVAVVTIS